MACEVSWLGIAGELRNLYLSRMSIDPAYRPTRLLFLGGAGRARTDGPRIMRTAWVCRPTSFDVCLCSCCRALI